MIEEIFNFLPLSESLLSSGMPTAGQVKELADSGVQVVINLAIPSSPKALPDEASLVKSLGMEYVSIPVVWEGPKSEELEAFFNAMEQHRDEKTLVHCQANYRATAFITLYRVRKLGWEPERALKDLYRIWNPKDYPVWRKFLDDQLKVNQ